jgi:hypothetical protein
VEELADIYAFLLWQFGHEGFAAQDRVRAAGS